MQILRLANEDQTTVIDLFSGPFRLETGFDFATPGQGGAFVYEPYGAQWTFGNFQPQTEVFDLALKGSSTVVLAAMDKLQNFLESVRLFHAGDLAAKSCWLEWSADGEKPKRTLLYSGTFKVISRSNVTPGLMECTVLGTLSLSRHPLWESKTFSCKYGNNISTLGGKLDYTGITGNTLARIWFFRFLGSVGANLYRHWIGIRRINQGVTGFHPVWECEWGTPNAGNGAAVAPDVTASNYGVGNTKITVTYGPVALVERMTITVAQVIAGALGGTANHFQGRYLVLLRCKVSAAGTSGVQLHYGYTGNMTCDEVYVDNTDWRLIPLGNISISPWEGNQYSTDMYMSTFRLDIYTEQLTPAHNLYLDCLILIPNEHMLTLEGTLTSSAAYDEIWTTEDDREIAYEYNPVAATVNDALDSGFTDWYFPPGDGTIIFAAEDQAIHHAAETISINAMCYYPRWTLYRGV